MDSANTPAISENVDTMNISNNQECLKDSMNEPKQTVEVNPNAVLYNLI